jgi:hypothetical protein
MEGKESECFLFNDALRAHRVISSLWNVGSFKTVINSPERLRLAS